MSDPTSSYPADASTLSIEAGNAMVTRLRQEIGKAVIGQEQVVDFALVSLLAAGHLLIEGVPGLGKTLLVRSIAQCISGDFSRIQFTPDLMPSDVTGHAFYDQKNDEFKIRKGPAFTNLLLADEINRAPAKTQASLLEVMQEKQITIEGEAYQIERPYMVMATQNPLEQEGTYPLPEAELDRFLLNVTISYPELEDEVDLVKMVTGNRIGDSFAVDQLEAVASLEDIVNLQTTAAAIPIDDSVFAYAVRLVAASRSWPGVRAGAGPRASIAMVRASRAYVLLRGGSFVTPDDIKAIAPAVFRHRLALSAELEIEGIGVERIINDILEQVEAPRS